MFGPVLAMATIQPTTLAKPRPTTASSVLKSTITRRDEPRRRLRWRIRVRRVLIQTGAGLGRGPASAGFYAPGAVSCPAWRAHRFPAR